jgi:predicted acetyltransferase
MKPQFKYTKAQPEDIGQLGHILEQCFMMSAGDSANYANFVGLDNCRVIYRDQQIAGGLVIYSMAQWWGGECVPMAGIAAVGIAPEYRGDGAAIALMQNALQEIHSQQIPISVLYPATQRLYRKAGYEQAGSYCIWEVPTQSIQITENCLPVQAVDSKNYELFHSLHQQQAKLTQGYLDRHPGIWQLLVHTEPSDTVYCYLIGEKDQPQGYIIFIQERTKDGSILGVRDWVLLSHEAVITFWSFLAKHRSQIDKIRWKSSITDALTLVLPEQTAKIYQSDRWMLRIVDVCKALATRGYPPEIAAELHLEIQDNLLSHNQGKFILSVANGRGEVTKGGKGDFKLDIQALAPLYSNLFTPHQLQLAGKLNTTATALTTATQIFASASPWMMDFF